MTLAIPDEYMRLQRDLKTIQDIADPLRRYQKDLDIVEAARKIQEQAMGIRGLIEQGQRRALEAIDRFRKEMEIIERYRALAKAVMSRVTAHGNIRAKEGTQSKGNSTTRKSAKSASSSGDGGGGGDGDGDGPPPKKSRPRKPRASTSRIPPKNPPSSQPGWIVLPPPPPQPPQPSIVQGMNPHVPIFGMLCILLLVFVLLGERDMVAPILVLMGNSIGKLTSQKSKRK